MSNEIQPSSVTTDISAVAATAEFISVADRMPLPSHPCFTYIGQATGRSLTVSAPIYGPVPQGYTARSPLPNITAYSEFSATAESVTVANYAELFKQAEESRLLKLDGGWLDSSVKIGQSAALGHALTLRDVGCAAAANGTHATNESGNVLTWSIVLDAQAALRSRGCEGQQLMVLHPDQYDDLLRDWAGVVSPAPNAAWADVFGKPAATGYVGFYGGLDIFVTTAVAASGSDWVGFIGGPGAIFWADGPSNPSELLARAGLQFAVGPVLVTIQSDVNDQATKVNFSELIGADVGRDDALQKIITKAY